MLPTSPNTVTKTIPAYLYLQYKDDPDLEALVLAYNTIAQEYLDWFNTINLPIYYFLSGKLLDWIGAGIYGMPRPNIQASVQSPIVGAVATAPLTNVFKDAFSEVPLAPAASAQPAALTQYVITDDIYKRVLTWHFYKGDGMEWSIQWLKRRITRFLFGVNGADIPIVYTNRVYVTMTPNTQPQQMVIDVFTPDTQTAQIFKAGADSGVIQFPFRYVFTDYVGGVLTKFPIVNVYSNPVLHLDNPVTPLDESTLS